MRWRFGLIAVGLALGIIGLSIAYWSHFFGFEPWQPVAVKMRIGGLIADGELYRSNEGLLAIVLPIKQSEARVGRYLSDVNGSVMFPAYVFRPTKPANMIAGGNYFAKKFGKLWEKPDGALGIELFPGGDAKTGIDPHVTFKPGHLEFTTAEHKRVVVDF